MRIGLLEDNTAIHEYITTALELAGHTVFTHTVGMSLLNELFADTGSHSPLPYELP